MDTTRFVTKETYLPGKQNIQTTNLARGAELRCKRAVNRPCVEHASLIPHSPPAQQSLHYSTTEPSSPAGVETGLD